jgi:hypothetical protein
MQEKEDIIRNLQARNEVLSRQIISLLQSRQFLNGEPSAIGEYKERLADFIWRVSGRSEDDDLYQQLAEEFLIELKADRVSIMVMGSGSTNMAVSQQACSELGTWVPTPYFISFETNDPYKLFLDEVASTDSVCNREWPQDVFEHPNVSLRAACARRVQLEYGGDWIVCLQWVNAPPNWTHKEESLFVELTDYAALVIEQAQLASSIKELRDQNESLIQSMPSAIIGLDFLGNVTFWGARPKNFWVF